MRRRKHYVELPDDGLVVIPAGRIAGHRQFTLVTPDEAHQRAVRIMAGFDELSPAERAAWNYAPVSHAFNPSLAPTHYRDKKAIARRGVKHLLDDMGLL